MVKRLNAILAVRLEGIAQSSECKTPSTWTTTTSPQPDVTVLRFRDDYYGSQHPTPADVLLAIEVADTSLRYDRDEKMPLYGRAGIPEAWLVDVQAQTITVYTRSLTQVDTVSSMYVTRGQEIMSVAVEGLRVGVDEALG